MTRPTSWSASPPRQTWTSSTKSRPIVRPAKCAVLITEEDRSLVTKLDAANHYRVPFGECHQLGGGGVGQGGGHRPGSSLPSARPPCSRWPSMCCARPRTRAFHEPVGSLPVPVFLKDPMLQVMAQVWSCFGNETEADAFAEANGLRHQGFARRLPSASRLALG